MSAFLCLFATLSLHAEEISGLMPRTLVALFPSSVSDSNAETKAPYNSIFFTDLGRGWVVGSHGEMITTKDGGKTWEPQKRITAQHLQYIYFVDDNHGWVVGHNGTILATKDGGNTWAKQSSNTINDLTGLFFFDANTGWAVGSEQTLLRTSDGGKTWRRAYQDTYADILAYNGIAFAEKGKGWIWATNGLMFTDDGGETWRAAEGGLALDQVDGHWKAPTDGLAHVNQINWIHFADPKNGWALGARAKTGVVLTTHDGGQNWDEKAFRPYGDRGSCPVPMNGWILGQGTIIGKTVDGGQSWIRQDMSNPILGIFRPSNGFYFYDFRFLDSAHGWAVGEAYSHPAIATTNDGGETWTEQNDRFTFNDVPDDTPTEKEQMCSGTPPSVGAFLDPLYKIAEHGDLTDIPFLENVLGVNFHKGGMAGKTQYYKASPLLNTSLDIFLTNGPDAYHPKQDLLGSFILNNKSSGRLAGYIGDCMKITPDDLSSHFHGKFIYLGEESDGGTLGGPPSYRHVFRMELPARTGQKRANKD